MSSVYGIMAPRFEIYEGTEMTMPVEYAAIKAAVINLTVYFAKYYKGSNIRFNCLCPGGNRRVNHDKAFVEKYSKYGMSKGLLDKEDLMGTFAFLLSDESKMINGQNIVVDDGFTL
jgi:NAD(P)-dependent dehydrogenase (short-subunit alcohol dehydrogenase family)